jgi:serine/threonine-protein kinase SRPK3
MISGMLSLLQILIVLFAEYLQLCLRDRSYWALKVHVHTLKHNQELNVYRHLASITKAHSGRKHIRQLEDSFKLRSRYGEHDVFVMTPLGMSLRTLQEMQQKRIFQQDLVVGALDQVLIGLNFLHEADVIHGGKSTCPGNISGIFPSDWQIIRSPRG